MTGMHCQKTRYIVMVTLDRSRLVEERHSDLVAALLKAIAQYTGGQTAAAVAYEEDLTECPGMRFTFSDRSSRDLFWRRVSQCLDSVTLDALLISPLGIADGPGAEDAFLRDSELPPMPIGLGLRVGA